MSTFHRLKISKITQLTPDSVALGLELPEELQEQFRFIPGQHVIVRAKIDGRQVRRTYSFCSAPGEPLRLAVRRIEGGVFSGFVNKILKAGDRLDVSEPLGTFRLAPEEGQHYVGVAAGSGITPILSMIRSTLNQTQTGRFHLLYGNRDKAHTMFFDELAGLKDRYINRLSLDLFFSQQAVDIPLLAGRITGDRLARIYQTVWAQEPPDGFYLCGPKAMVENCRETLLALGVNAGDIHSELFFAEETAPVQRAHKGPAQAKIKIINDGRTFEIDYREEHGSLLDAALSAGLDVSYACKGGVCATCRAKVVEGRADMGTNYGLEPEEIKAGFILTCQSHPLSKTLTLSYDE